MIEAMACGTPVVAYACGSVPEVIDPGVTGFIVRDDDEAADAILRVDGLDRKRVRLRFEERFSSEAMAGGTWRCTNDCAVVTLSIPPRRVGAKRLTT
jgi:glycosyltransferase involved in cell wall biosynthesis